MTPPTPVCYAVPSYEVAGQRLGSGSMRARARDTTVLTVGAALNGLLAYVLFSLTTRALGAEAAAPVSVLWTYWSFSAAALTFPLQHWIARSVAAHGGEGAVHRALPRIASLVAVTGALAGLVAWLTREALFHRGDAAFPILVGCVTLGAGFVGVVRGGLSARHRFGGVAAVLVAENGSRCVAALALALAGVQSPVAYGICLAGGALVGFLWPSSFRFSRDEARDAADSPLRFVSGAAGGQLIGQAVLVSGPVVLVLSGGSAAQVTALFAGMALFRAPYTFAIGLVSQLTGRLTRLVVEQRYAVWRRLRALVMAAAVVSSAVAAAVGGGAGPFLVRLVFGQEVRIEWFPSMLVGIGSALALVNLVVTIMLLAQGRSVAVARAWVLGSLGGALLFVLVAAQEPMTRTCWAFVAAEGLSFAALTVEELRGWSARRLSSGTGGG
ncbi:MAG: oligosaccharide flippase family protein [Propionibacteriales bacterium]|nr:oligosaccharide flippase family protein [Propionibacteriales bacterium]